MKITEAQNYIQCCVLELNPEKVFIEIGEEDLPGRDFNIDEFIACYEWLLYSIHKETRADIYILSTFGYGSDDVNLRLRKLTNESGCVYIDVADIYNCEKSDLLIMNKLKYYIRRGNINFYDAINIVSV